MPHAGTVLDPPIMTTDQPFDTIVRSARVGVAGPIADIAICGGEVSAILPPGVVEVAPAEVDVDGCTVLPGLWDGHVHTRQWAIAQHAVDMSAADGPRTAAAMAQEASGAVVFGVRAELRAWPEAPHKEFLVGESRPVVVQSADLHQAWLNEAALAASGFRGHPTGVLHETDCFVAVAAFSAEAEDWVLATLRAAAARGIVGIVDFEMADNVADWTRRAASCTLPVRVDCSIPHSLADAAIDHGLRAGASPAGRVRVGPVKVFLDGSLSSGTALLDPRDPPLVAADDLTEVVTRMHDNGLTTAVHAIGDLATTRALDGFEAAGVGGRIEHAQLLEPGAAERFAALRVTASVQPGHLGEDRDLPLWFERGTDGAYAYATLHAAGVELELGSDAPVTSLDPWQTLAAAVNRRRDDRRPPWLPHERLGLEVALAVSSRGRRGIAPGDPADLTIVGPDFGADLDALASTEVYATMVDGEWTYQT